MHFKSLNDRGHHDIQNLAPPSLWLSKPLYVLNLPVIFLACGDFYARSRNLLPPQYLPYAWTDLTNIARKSVTSAMIQAGPDFRAGSLCQVDGLTRLFCNRKPANRDNLVYDLPLSHKRWLLTIYSDSRF